MLDTIINLSEAISKIKFDEAFTNAVADYLGGKVDMDCEGNVYLNKKENTPILILAPFFTYPFSVEKVCPDGAIGIELYDAPSHFPLPGSDVLVHGKEVYKGVVGSVPPHLQKGYQSGNAYALTDLKCDVCKDFEELQKTVFPGTRITYRFKPYSMLGGKMVGRNFDLTAPAAALLKCADELDKDLFTVCFCNNYHFALEATKPCMVIVLDVIDIEQRKKDHKHGEGLEKLYIETGTTVNFAVRDILKSVANEAGIAYDILARCDRTEDVHPLTWDVQTALGGTPVCTVYLPYEGGSSGVQVMAENAAEQLAKMLKQIKTVPERSELCLKI